jgi:hypothetical protein
MCVHERDWTSILFSCNVFVMILASSYFCLIELVNDLSSSMFCKSLDKTEFLLP